MVNDSLVNAIDMMIEMCNDKKQAAGMSSLREFICDFCEDEWEPLSLSEKQESIEQYLSCPPQKAEK